MFASLGIQIVVYENSAVQLTRLCEGLRATITDLGQRHPNIGDVHVRFGDCATPGTLRACTDQLTESLQNVASVSTEHFGENLGSAGGSNRLAESGDDDLIWVLNPDTYPAPTAAARLVDAVQGHNVAAADARQIPIELPRHYDLTTGDTSWVSGSSMMLRRDAFTEVGGFDSEFFPMYCDDVDLSWRLRARGWRIVHAPTAVLFHDKRLNNDGHLICSAFEHQSAARARLWLARRYERPDIEAATLAEYRSHDDPAYAEIADEFEAAVAAGATPTGVERASDVADFVGQHYGKHRF